MISYLWIGLGGALGSIARAWLALAVASITGPQFPWGTILINIIGSFVIGFFGTLTASGSRFSVPSDARTFGAPRWLKHRLSAIDSTLRVLGTLGGSQQRANRVKLPGHRLV
jgi:hypothetical protein